MSILYWRGPNQTKLGNQYAWGASSKITRVTSDELCLTLLGCQGVSVERFLTFLYQTGCMLKMFGSPTGQSSWP